MRETTDATLGFGAIDTRIAVSENDASGRAMEHLGLPAGYASRRNLQIAVDGGVASLAWQVKAEGEDTAWRSSMRRAAVSSARGTTSKPQRRPRSSVGALFSNRSNASVGQGASQTYGMDGTFSFLQDFNLTGYYARTKLPGVAATLRAIGVGLITARIAMARGSTRRYP